MEVQFIKGKDTEIKIIFFYILTATLAIWNIQSFAKEGGNSSGGGDLLGIDEIQPALFSVIEEIKNSDHEIYRGKQIRALKKVFKVDIKVLVANSESFQKDHAVDIKGITQISTAKSYSVWFGPKRSATLAINEDKWKQAPDRAAQYALINHELCVMAGVEETGDYGFTLKFANYIRKKLLKSATFQTVIYRLELFKLEKDLSGKSIIGKKIDEIEVRANDLEKTSFQSEFKSSKNILVTGCIDKLGYLAAGFYRPNDSVNKDQLGTHCENLSSFLNQKSTHLSSMRIYYDPSAEMTYEPKAFEVQSETVFISMSVLRY